MQIVTGNILIDIIGFFVAILAVIYAYFQWTFLHWKRRNIPYFQPKFPLGNKQSLSKSAPLGEDLFHLINDAKNRGWKYFGLFFGGSPFFVPLDLDILKLIFTKDFNYFTDRGFYYNEKDDPLSAHLFALGGLKWKNLRHKLTPTFTSGKLKSMFQTLVDCGLILDKNVEKHAANGPIEIKNLLACFTADVIGSCAFGLEVNSFNDPDTVFLSYGRKIFHRNVYWKLINLIELTFPELSKTLHLKVIPTDVSNFFTDVVTKSVKYREQNNYSRNDFLQLLIDMNKMGADRSTFKGDGTTVTLNEMTAQCLVFFLAGFETSSTTMTFALFEMSLNPEIQEKVREELSRVLKKYDNNICYESAKELDYMQQVIDETLRKYPPVPIITRQCVEDYRIPGTDVLLEKGTKVMIPVKNIHYNEKIYDNPEKFDPERFSPENKLKRHQYAHLPFGEGPRICIGARFGLMQTKVGLATILRKFRVTLNSKTKIPLEMDPTSNIPSSKDGMWLNMIKL